MMCEQLTQGDVRGRVRGRVRARVRARALLHAAGALGVAWGALGCIQEVLVTDDAGVGGAEGGSVPPPPPGGATPVGGSVVSAGVTAGSAPPPPPPAGVMASSCTPGERPAPCMVCDISGQLITPLSETSCPDLDCAAQSNYRLVDLEGGVVECRRQRLSNGPSQCQGLGACFTRAEYCQREVEEGFLEPIIVNECRVIEGCDGHTEGVMVIKAGDPCDNGQGTCDEQGECSTAPPPPPPPPAATCESAFGVDFPQVSASRLCLNNNPQAPQLCDLQLDKSTNGGVRYSCLAVCSMHGAVCEAAWNDNGVCNPNPNAPQACEVAGLDSFVCRCRLP